MAIIRKFFIWILLYLIFLEIFLRLGGLITVWKEDVKSFNSRGDYKIICIGDSVTGFGSYPEDLQEILNAKQNKIHFVVLNLGTPSAGVDFFVQNLPGYIDQYKPNLVVSMIGLTERPTSENLLPINRMSPLMLWKKSSVLRLIQSLGAQLLEKILSIEQNMFPHMQGIHRPIIDKKDTTIDSYLDTTAVMVAHNPTFNNYMQLGVLCRLTNKRDQALQSFLKAVEIDPNNYAPWRLIAEDYWGKGDYEKAIPALFQCARLCPDSNSDEKIIIYEELYKSFYSTQREDQLNSLYKFAIVNSPNLSWGYDRFGSYLMQKNDFVGAKNIFMKEISIAPNEAGAYTGLSRYFIQIGDVSSAIKILEIGIKINPHSPLIYDLLAKVFSDNNDVERAEMVLEKSLHIPPSNPDALKNLLITNGETMYDCQMLLKMYDLDNKPELSVILKPKIEQYEQLRSNAYERIFKMLEDRGIPLIAVQYPMKSVETLRKSLPAVSNMLYFVDNESSFKKGVAESGYFDYFVNQEFTELGHLTPKGCLLLAKNISYTVLDVLKLNH